MRHRDALYLASDLLDGHSALRIVREEMSSHGVDIDDASRSLMSAVSPSIALRRGSRYISASIPAGGEFDESWRAEPPPQFLSVVGPAVTTGCNLT